VRRTATPTCGKSSASALKRSNSLSCSPCNRAALLPALEGKASIPSGQQPESLYAIPKKSTTLRSHFRVCGTFANVFQPGGGQAAAGILYRGSSSARQHRELYSPPGHNPDQRALLFRVRGIIRIAPGNRTVFPNRRQSQVSARHYSFVMPWVLSPADRSNTWGRLTAFDESDWGFGKWYTA